MESRQYLEDKLRRIAQYMGNFEQLHGVDVYASDRKTAYELQLIYNKTFDKLCKYLEADNGNL